MLVQWLRMKCGGNVYADLAVLVIDVLLLALMLWLVPPQRMEPPDPAQLLLSQGKGQLLDLVGDRGRGHEDDGLAHFAGVIDGVAGPAFLPPVVAGAEKSGVLHDLPVADEGSPAPAALVVGAQAE